MGSVAHTAHLGGAFFGLLYYMFWDHQLFSTFKKCLAIFASILTTIIIYLSGMHLGIVSYQEEQIIKLIRDCNKYNQWQCDILKLRKIVFKANFGNIKKCKYLNRTLDDQIDICYIIGREFLNSKEYVDAIPFLTKACESKEIWACTDLSFAYSQSKNFMMSKKYSKISCELGDGLGCYNFACSLCRDKNPSEAMTFLARGAKIYKLTKQMVSEDKELDCVRSHPEYDEFFKTLSE
ncbi:MAG: hypothetical protein QE271_08980 [Bacteriovoracaceae bacterium]|nr:hypothetical protein [Bacteriovoracaceae bacterium]